MRNTSGKPPHLFGINNWVAQFKMASKFQIETTPNKKETKANPVRVAPGDLPPWDAARPPGAALRLRFLRLGLRLTVKASRQHVPQSQQRVLPEVGDGDLQKKSFERGGLW